MKFHTLVLEGDYKAEKDRHHPPAYTKEDYLRRKWIESRPPLHNRSFYLCRMVEEELKGIDIDGSGKITICAHQIRSVPGGEKYICNRDFKVSMYYLDQVEIDTIADADEDAEPMVLWGILRNAMLDIAKRNYCSEDVIGKIEGAFDHIVSRRFVREDRIGKLTKRDGDTGMTAYVERVLSAETGEGWRIRIADRKGVTCRQETMDGGTRYVDRLGSQLYAKAEWCGDMFVIYERFGKEVFHISAHS